ncbi:MAG: DUF2807 domain-containing protein [Bacteroidales bacterium]|nr:DUF2807 domain-containing protein [Bacteroidales bacterium]
MKRFIIIALILISCVSCKKAPLTNGDIVSRTTELSSFNTINIYDNIDVNLIKSDTFKIEITTGDNLIENIVCEVADSILTLRNENIMNWIRSYDYPLSANIYFKDDIKKIYYESVGHLKSDDYICDDTLSNLTLTLMQGSGDINLRFNCRSFSLFSNDKCTNKINLEGKSSYGTINQRGLGPIYAEEMSCRNLSVHSTDVNDIYVNCRDNLSVQIYHSGNVYYKGHPEINLYIAPNARGKLVSIDSDFDN